jgi:hypothetical protein
MGQVLLESALCVDSLCEPLLDMQSHLKIYIPIAVATVRDGRQPSGGKAYATGLNKRVSARALALSR